MWGRIADIDLWSPHVHVSTFTCSYTHEHKIIHTSHTCTKGQKEGEKDVSLGRGYCNPHYTSVHSALQLSSQHSSQGPVQRELRLRAMVCSCASVTSALRSQTVQATLYLSCISVVDHLCLSISSAPALGKLILSV